MVRDHVAQRAGLFVVARAAANAHRLGRGDLHVIDVVTIPDRLEERIAEPENEDVPYRLFPEIMIDTIDLLLAKNGAHLLIQPSRALDVVSERFFDDDARP